jgi:glycosyltransferase involved in cell wall biosynthesis
VVSVIVPNYRHANYLRARLESIINQTYTDYECIMLDDSSSDHSVEILKEYVERDPRFKLFVNDVNSGSTFAQWNLGVTKANGKYIWIAESDDVADCNFLKTAVDILEHNNDIALTYCQSMLIDESDMRLGLWNYDEPIFNRNFQMCGIEFIESFLLVSNYIPNASAVVFRKSDFNNVGKSVVELTNNGDWNLWLKLLTRGDLYFISKPMNLFRQHQHSVTARAKKKILYKNKFDTSITNLRSNFDLFLFNTADEKLLRVRKNNEKIISYELGNFGLYLHKEKKYLSSLYYILKASFYPNFKSYYLKRLVFGNFYHRLFEK